MLNNLLDVGIEFFLCASLFHFVTNPAKWLAVHKGIPLIVVYPVNTNWLGRLPT
jgi:hypothetical protein